MFNISAPQSPSKYTLLDSSKLFSLGVSCQTDRQGLDPNIPGGDIVASLTWDFSIDSNKTWTPEAASAMGRRFWEKIQFTAPSLCMRGHLLGPLS